MQKNRVGNRRFAVALSVVAGLGASTGGNTGAGNRLPGDQPFGHPALEVDTVVINANGPMRSVVAVRDGVLGAFDGPPDHTFTMITQVAGRPDGSVLVVDLPRVGAGTLKEYDAAGKLVRTVARAGQGPGEFMSSGGMDVGPDGRIYLWDVGQRRVNVYRRDGKVAATWRLDSGGGIGGRGLWATRGGYVYVRAAELLRGRTRALRAGEWSMVATTTHLLRISPEGTILDTVDVDLPRHPSATVQVTGVGARGSEVRNIRVPFYPTSVWTVSPLGYLVTATTDRFAVELHVTQNRLPRAPRDTIISIRRNVTPVQVTDAERRDIRRMLEQMASATNAKLPAETRPVPSTKPVFRDLEVADDGRIWLRVHTPSVELSAAESRSRGATGYRVWKEPVAYDVVQADGSFLGRVYMPDDAEVLRIRADTLWCRELNSDGLQRLARYVAKW